MTNDVITALVLFIISELFVINAFFEQRAALNVSRELGYDIKPSVLPSWYPVTNIFRILSWGCLIYMFFMYAWYLPVVALIISFIVTSIIPVPKGKYVKMYKKLSDSGKY